MPDFLPPVSINDQIDVSGFDCGHESLNRFLTDHALGKQNARLSRTYVVTNSKSKALAYYTLALTVVVNAEPPKSMARGMPNEIPAILLARLAVDRSVQGQKIGRFLLIDALQRINTANQLGPAPVRLIVVDAIDDQAKAFYQKYGFLSPPSGGNRLYLSSKSLHPVFETE